jgi:hypothetical protein
MTPEELFGQFLGLGKAWCVHEARLEARSSTSLLKVDETTQLWPEENTRAGIPDDQIRQVAKSPSRQVGRSAGRQVGRSAGRQVGRSESLGPCKVQRDNWAEVTQAAMPDLGHVERPTHTTGCLPKLRRRFHGWGSFLIGVYSHLGASDYFSQMIYFCLRIILFLFDLID